MLDDEAASPRWKLNPKNFGPNIKSIKFLGSGVKTRVGRVSGNIQKILGLTLKPRNKCAEQCSYLEAERHRLDGSRDDDQMMSWLNYVQRAVAAAGVSHYAFYGRFTIGGIAMVDFFRRKSLFVMGQKRNSESGVRALRNY